MKTLALMTTLMVGAMLWQSAGTGEASSNSRWATVIHVRDGDTIVVNIDGGNPTYAQFPVPNGGTGTGIRFRGVNTFNGPGGQGDPLEDCWGQAATDLLRLPATEPGGKLGLVGRRVRLVGPMGVQHVDAHGRLPMRVFYVENGVEIDIAKTILKAGLGLPQPSMQLTDKQVAGYRKKAANAMSANRRIWKDNKCGGGPSNGAVLTLRVMSDADGDDAMNLGGEWVEVRNDSPPGSADVKLKDWQLRDADQLRLTDNPNDHRTYFTFPARDLAPGQSVRVYGGTTLPPGAPPGSLSWGNTREIFLNRAEIVVLMDPHGDIRAYFDWPCDASLKTTTSCTHPLSGKVALWAHYNPYGGPDKPEDEWIDIWNVSSAPVNLRGDYIRDDSDTYLFDTDTFIAPGSFLRLRVGRGTDAPGVRWWGKTTLILQDSGDRVDLLDLQGRLAACYGWGTETCKKPDLNWNLDVVVNYDGEGNNGGSDTQPAEVPNNEWIKIWNRGTQTRDLSGFILELHGSLHPLPAGTVLAPGQRLRVRMGTGQTTTFERFWGMSGTNVVPNAQGTVNLWDPTFRNAGSFTWPCSTTECPTPPPIRVQTHCPGVNDADSYEWIRVRNLATSGPAVDLSDWYLKTSRHHHFYFPDGTSIPPGGTITVFVFPGTNSGTNLYWGKTEPIIKSPNSTGGETLEVFSPLSTQPVDAYISNTTQNPGSCGDLSDLRMVVQFDGQGTPNSSSPPPETPNTEWIRIWNDESHAVNLHGYRLEAPVIGGSTEYTIQNVTLQPGQSLRIFMGTGTDTTFVKYWGVVSDSQALPNAGNTNSVSLWDTAGVRVEVYTWLCPGCVEPEVRVNGYCTGTSDSDPDEWVRIKNNSSQTVDLTDWFLMTGRNWHFNFPDGTTIAAGATIRVWTKAGTNTSSDLYWNLPNPILRSVAVGETVETWGPRGKSIAVYAWNTTTNPAGNC